MWHYERDSDPQDTRGHVARKWQINHEVYISRLDWPITERLGQRPSASILDFKKTPLIF